MKLSGSMDLTRGNAAANLLKFALPFLLAYFMQVLYSAVDFMVVGHFCDGSAGVSAVANGSEVMNLIMSLILGLTTGATVLIGRYYGAKNMEKVNASIGMVLSLSTLIALGMTAVVVPCIPFIVHCLKTPPEAVRKPHPMRESVPWGFSLFLDTMHFPLFSEDLETPRLH